MNDLEQINARLESIERMLSALYVPLLTEQQRQVSRLPREQRKAAERDMIRAHRAAKGTS